MAFRLFGQLRRGVVDQHKGYDHIDKCNETRQVGLQLLQELNAAPSSPKDKTLLSRIVEWHEETWTLLTDESEPVVKDKEGNLKSLKALMDVKDASETVDEEDLDFLQLVAAQHFALRLMTQRILGHLAQILRSAFQSPLDLFSVTDESFQKQSPSRSPLNTRVRHFIDVQMKPFVDLLFGSVLSHVAERHSQWVSVDIDALRAQQSDTLSGGVSQLRLLSLFVRVPNALSGAGISPGETTVPHLSMSVREERVALIDILAALFENATTLFEWMNETHPEAAKEYLTAIYDATHNAASLFDIMRHDQISSIIDFYDPICDCARLLIEISKHVLKPQTSSDLGILIQECFGLSKSPAKQVQETSAIREFKDPMILNDLNALFCKLDDFDRNNLVQSWDEETALMWQSRLGLLKAMCLQLTLQIIDTSSVMQSLFIATNGIETLLHAIYEALTVTEAATKNITVQQDEGLDEIYNRLLALPILDKTTLHCLGGILALSQSPQGSTYIQETTEVSRAVIDLTSRVICIHHQMLSSLRILDTKRASQECLADVSSPSNIESNVLQSSVLLSVLLLLRQSLAWRYPSVTLSAYTHFVDKVIVEYGPGRVLASLSLLCADLKDVKMNSDSLHLTLLVAEIMSQCLVSAAFTELVQDTLVMDALTPTSVECYGSSLGFDQDALLQATILNACVYCVLHTEASPILLQSLHLACLYNDTIRKKLMSSLIKSLNEGSEDGSPSLKGEANLWSVTALQELGRGVSHTPFLSLLHIVLMYGVPASSEVRAALSQLRLVPCDNESGGPVSLLCALTQYVCRAVETRLDEKLMPVLLTLCSWSSFSRYIRPLDRSDSKAHHSRDLRKLRKSPIGVWENLHFEKALFLSPHVIKFYEALIGLAVDGFEESAECPLSKSFAALLVVGTIARGMQVTEMMEINPTGEISEIFSPDEFTLFSSALSQVALLIPSAKASRLINAASDLQKLIVGGKLPMAGVPPAQDSIIERLTVTVEGTGVSVSDITPVGFFTKETSTFIACVGYPPKLDILMYLSPLTVSHLKIRSPSYPHLVQSFLYSFNQLMEDGDRATPPEQQVSAPGPELSAIMKAISALEEKIDKMTVTKQTVVMERQASAALDLASLSKKELIAIIGALAVQLEDARNKGVV